MKTTAFACAFLAGIAAAPTLAAPQAPNRAAEIARLLQTWQSRILVNALPVDDARNWSLRNMAKFARLSDERLALAQEAQTLPELELALVEAPVATGSPLDVLMANPPGNLSMVRAGSAPKSSPASSPPSYAGLVFTALSPCRILDTRVSQGGSGPWAAGSVNLVKIGPYATGYATGPGAQGGSATSCGLDALAGPGQVAVIMAAVSTVSQAGPGYLTFFPQGSPNPGATSVSQWYQPGYVQTSFVMIPSDLASTVAASGYTSAATEVILDVVGYFVPAAGSGNITLVPSTATAGNILKGSASFIHNFGAANTFIGEGAGNFTLTGAQNTGNGYGALGSSTTGSFNIAVGKGALSALTSGSANIAIGDASGISYTTESGNITIFNPGQPGDSGKIRIGSSPPQLATYIVGIRGATTTFADAIPVLIASDGQLGTASSSRRVKDDIADMDAASGALMKLRPVTFHYKSDRTPSGRVLQYGLVAEEVAEVYPGLVAHSTDGQIESVMYQFLPPMLLNEYQKQQRTIEAQAAEIAGLKAAVGEIAELRAQTARLSRLLEGRRAETTPAIR